MADDHRRPAAFPESLLSRFTPIERIGWGGEAVVYLARPSAEARVSWRADLVALKIYEDKSVNADVIRAIGQDLFLRHVPRMYDFGNIVQSSGRNVGWEAQEYCALGSLARLIQQRRNEELGPFAETEVHAMAGELARCVEFWQQEIGYTHTDIKPANVLVRSASPYSFAIGDVGGVVRNSVSQEIGHPLLTPRYAAPETVHRVARQDEPTAWWSVGMIVYELLAGHEPYPGMSDSEIISLLRRNVPPDLSPITDPRWLQLLGGLLRVDRAARWRHGEVTEWLAGRTPQSRPLTVRFTPLEFSDALHHEPAELLQNMQLNWERAAAWLADEDGAADLEQWLGEVVGDRGLDRILHGIAGDHRRALLALAELAAHFLPDTRPRYKGVEIDEAGLLNLALGSHADQLLLREVIESGILTVAARHRCHVSCPGPCRVLTGVMAEVPLVIGEARKLLNWHLNVVQEESRRLGLRIQAGEVPEAHEWDQAWALATELTMVPEAARSYRRRIQAIGTELDWWATAIEAAREADMTQIAGRGGLVGVWTLARYAAELDRRQRIVQRPADPGRGRSEQARKAGRVVPYAILALVLGGLAAYGGEVLRGYGLGAITSAYPGLAGVLDSLRSARATAGLDLPTTRWLDEAGAWACAPLAVLLIATFVAKGTRTLWRRHRLRYLAGWVCLTLSTAVVVWLAATALIPLTAGAYGLLTGARRLLELL